MKFRVLLIMLLMLMMFTGCGKSVQAEAKTNAEFEAKDILKIGSFFNMDANTAKKEARKRHEKLATEGCGFKTVELKDASGAVIGSEVFEYGANGLANIYDLFNRDAPQRNSRLTYSYDQKGNVTERTYYTWNTENSSWVEYSKQKFTYTADRTPASEETQQWSSEKNDFVPYCIVKITRDGKGREIKTKFYWDEDTSKMNERSWSEYSYDAKGNLIEKVDYEKDGDTAVPESKVTYKYKGGNPVEETYLSYNTESASWNAYSCYEYSYTGKNRTGSKFYFYEDGKRILNVIETDSYSADGKTTVAVEQSVDYDTQAMVNVSKKELVCDEYGRQVSLKCWQWEDGKWTAAEYYECSYTKSVQAVSGTYRIGDFESGSVTDGVRFAFDCDKDGRPVSEKYFVWDADSSSWKEDFVYEFVY